jgi:ABC-type antimicrobial peptide transport system permease subunit
MIQVNLSARRKYHPSSLSWYVIHHMLRSSLKSYLTLAIALGFTLALGWIYLTMERTRIEVNKLYDNTVVSADVVLADPSAEPTGGTLTAGYGFVYLQTVEGILNSGFVKSSVLEADTNWVSIQKVDSQESSTGFFPVYAYDGPETTFSALADPGSLIFASGWDMNLFAESRSLDEIQKDGVPALFPASLLEQLQLNVGETVKITDYFHSTYPCVIVGQFSGGRVSNTNSVTVHVFSSTGDSILISLPTMEAMERSKTAFTVAHFVLDPSKNRELPQLQADMDKVVKAYGAGTSDLRFKIWDEELRIVVAQLDKNLSLLKVLYPVVIAVSVLIGAGLCFLLLLQEAREAAILRVLGTTRRAVRLALIAEPLFLSIIGVIIGLGISRFLWMASEFVPSVPLLIGAGLYLAGVLAGLVIGAISVTNKKPIELLQVKE